MLEHEEVALLLQAFKLDIQALLEVPCLQAVAKQERRADFPR